MGIRHYHQYDIFELVQELVPLYPMYLKILTLISIANKKSLKPHENQLSPYWGVHEQRQAIIFIVDPVYA